MSELKTLKDLDFLTLHILERDEELDVVDRDDLKAEAVKWIKEDLTNIKNNLLLLVEERIARKLTNKWMRRLDITEKDLEENKDE